MTDGTADALMRTLGPWCWLPPIGRSGRCRTRIPTWSARFGRWSSWCCQPLRAAAPSVPLWRGSRVQSRTDGLLRRVPHRLAGAATASIAAPGWPSHQEFRLVLPDVPVAPSVMFRVPVPGNRNRAAGSQIHRPGSASAAWTAA